MIKDYKHTIHLPRTRFPMRGDLPRREPLMLAQWEQEGRYQQIQQHTASRDKVFVLHDGPPYANGAIHIGHAVNKLLKEMVVRSKLLAGYRAPYVPGWDCHGLPIEIAVEKKFGKPGQKLTAHDFRQQCREYAEAQIDEQRTGFKRLGILADWEKPYRTKDFSYEADMLRALAQMMSKGHVVRGAKPVHWCFDCASALAEAEIEYDNHSTLAIDVAYDAVDTVAVANRFGVDVGDAIIAVPIWTTTPWTLPESQAVALGREIDYVLTEGPIRAGRQIWLVVAATLVDKVLARYGMESSRPLARATGEMLAGLQLKHPLYLRRVPLVLGDHVSDEDGTGAVHTAPDHGVEDFVVGKQLGLRLLNYVDARGTYGKHTPKADDLELSGMHIWKANTAIEALLRERGVLLARAAIEHSYPHCWRHKTPVIFRATPQWFISMQQAELRVAALAAVKSVRWLPGWGEERISGMLTSRPDWCISRQRTWGVPIALFVHKDTQEPHPDSVALLEQIAHKVELEGIDAWHHLEPAELLGSQAQYYEKVGDVLDVWFDSGLTHFAVLKQRTELQAASSHYQVMYLEGSDQHRGWFQSSLLTSCAMYGCAPYGTVLTHGFAVDAEGRKMSKSQGNVIAPQKVIQTLGADVLRLWVASADYRSEMSVSEEILKRVSDSYRRLRNTTRFLLGNLDGFDPLQHLVPVEESLALDQWAVQQAYDVQQTVIAAYERYDFPAVVMCVQDFCVNAMGSLYLDITKDRLYTMPLHSHGRLSAQSAMYRIASALVRWLAPILAFTAEEIWDALPGSAGSSVLFETWYDGLVATHCCDKQRDWWGDLVVIRETASRVLESMRKDGKIGASLEANLVIYADAATISRYAPVADELRFFFITSDVHLEQVSSFPEGAVSANLKHGQVAITAHISQSTKCVRCWHRRDDVGSHNEHPQLCARCVENVDGAGEKRYCF